MKAAAVIANDEDVVLGRTCLCAVLDKAGNAVGLIQLRFLLLCAIPVIIREVLHGITIDHIAGQFEAIECARDALAITREVNTTFLLLHLLV